MENTHDLKIYPEYFWPVVQGIKTFEIRKNDSDFQIGDTLLLREYDPLIEEYTGNEITKKIIYMTSYAQRENYTVLAIV